MSLRTLVVAISDYVIDPLPGPVRDASAIADKLRSLKAPVTILLDFPGVELHRSVGDFVASVSAGDTVFIYFSGHGAQYMGGNFFLPRDYTAADEKDLPRFALNLQTHVIEPLATKRSRLNFIALDACRVEVSKAKGSHATNMSALAPISAPVYVS